MVPCFSGCPFLSKFTEFFTKFHRCITAVSLSVHAKQYFVYSAGRVGMRDDFDGLTNFNGVSTRRIIDPGPRNWGGFFCCAGACPKNDDEQYQKDEWSLTLHMKLPKERLRE